MQFLAKKIDAHLLYLEVHFRTSEGKGLRAVIYANLEIPVGWGVQIPKYLNGYQPLFKRNFISITSPVIGSL